MRLKHFNDSFIEYSNDMDGIYKVTGERNPTENINPF